MTRLIETSSGVSREWSIPASDRTSPRHRSAWVVIAVTTLIAFAGPQGLAIWTAGEWRFRPEALLFGFGFLPFIAIGIAMLLHANRMAATSRSLRIEGGSVILAEDRRGKVRESRLPLGEVRCIRQKRFRESFCWGAEILGRGRTSLRIETPWTREQMAEFVDEIRTTLWKPDDPRATRP